MEPTNSFGYWLRRRRKALDLTQDALARQAGCALGTLKKIETDERRPSRQFAERLADCLAIPTAERAAFVQAARAELATDQLAVIPQPREQPGLDTALPSGTVTFLFTDIAGSTALWQHHANAMPDVLARHEAMLRQTIETRGGVVFKTIGDAVCAAFASAPQALAAALDAHRALTAESWDACAPLDTAEPAIDVRVRMALHTGTAELRAGDYAGFALSRVARILAAVPGGQVLLSHSAHELVRNHLPPEAELRDLGLRHLKDLNLPERIFQLVAPGLPAAFPPLRTVDTRLINLPAQPTALIGREREIAAVGDLLRRDDVRLLTLTGPGGTGKTRLALQSAAELLDTFADGIWFVDLAPVSDPNLVVTAIAQTLGVKESGARPLIEDLKAYLREKQLLLLLDNFEQVLAAALLLAELLAALPRLKLLVTSREVLHLRGEKEFPVPPLALPDSQQLVPFETLSQYAAVQLFIARALDVKPDFMVTNENAPAVAEICVRLDGLPLAIELVAVRIKLFPPKTLLGRLTTTGGLATLTGGARDLPTRQQTLRATIAWSYNLLDQTARTLFAHLGVFVGGWTLEAAEAVCGDMRAESGDLAWGRQMDNPPPPIFELLVALVDQNLVRQVETADGAARFTMLETIREYARERLAASGAQMALERHHAAYFVALATEDEPFRWMEHREAAWYAQYAADIDNLRAALAWSHAASDGAEAEVRLVAALSEFWLHQGAFTEARAWIDQALERSHTASTLARAKLLNAAELLSFYDGAHARAMIFEEQGLLLWQQLGDRLQIADSHNRMARLARNLGDLERSQAAADEALRLFREAGVPLGIANALLALGDVAFDRGDYTQATALFQEGLALARQHDNPKMVAIALMTLARVARAEGDYVRATALYEESLAWFLEQGEAFAAFILFEMGWVKFDQGDYARATVIFRTLIIEYDQARWTLPAGLEGFAAIAAAQGAGERAAQLWGAAEAVRKATDMPMDVLDIPDYERWASAARAQLDDAAFAAAWTAGRAMTLEQAIAEALES